MYARARTDVHDEIGGAHGVLVVLDHEHGVAEVAELPERGEQLVVIALVQPDGRLVENVQNAHQTRADLRRQPDALALAAGERRGCAREREVVQPHRLQKAKAGAQLAQDLRRDDRRRAVQLQLVYEPQRVGDGQRAEVHNAHAAHRDRQRQLPQPPAAALGARARGHTFLQLLLHRLGLRFGKAAADIVQHALERALQRAAPVRALVVDGQLFRARAVEDGVLRRLRQRGKRLGERKVVFFRQRVKIHPRDGVVADVIKARRLDRAL